MAAPTQRAGLGPARERPLVELAMLFGAFAGLSLVVLEPASGGPFVSDDLGYVLHNPWVRDFPPGAVLAILHPAGQPAVDTLNWAPVHLFAHAAQWSLFEEQVAGYHATNAVLHTFVATLLAALLAARGAGRIAAGAAATLFLLHPAVVEAVAWISQLKSILALGFALAALLLHPRRPLLGLVCFALALLSKASAMLALPVTLVFSCCGPAADAWRARRSWLVAWVAVAALFAVAQGAILADLSELRAPLHPDPLVAARTIVAIGARYLVMAYTSLGVSALHEPPRAVSWLDPWWLLGLGLGGLLLWRVWNSFRASGEETGWWVWAAAAWAPISQVVPFLFVMADRYLYFILPGLIGGTLFAGRSLAASAFAPGAVGAADPRGRRVASRAALVGVALLALAFGVRAHERAALWQSSTRLSMDAASRYPDGMAAHTLRAQRAVRMGDTEAAVRELRGAVDRGYDRFMDLESAGAFEPIRNTPAFRALVRDVAGIWIATSLAKPEPTQSDLRWRGHAYAVREEYALAVAAFEEALRLGGALDADVRMELRRALSVHERARGRAQQPAGENSASGGLP